MRLFTLTVNTACAHSSMLQIRPDPKTQNSSTPYMHACMHTCDNHQQQLIHIQTIPVETTMSTSTNDFPSSVIEDVCALPVVCLQTANFDLNVGDIIKDKNTIIGTKW